MGFKKAKNTICVIDIFGAIEASSPSNPFGGDGKTNMQEVIKTLHNVAKFGPKKYAGVILRLNTPGGTTGTSEEVAMMVENVRKAGVPVIASVADCCCSGGFWIATACDYIFANRTSMVGSVGVIMQLPNFKGLSEKLGVSYVTVKAGKMKDIGNPFRDATEEEMAYLTDYAAETHEIFKEAILRNRKDVPEDVPEIFDGRPFSVDFALENHLIDEIGTYYDALDYLLDKQGLTEDSVVIERVGKKKGLLGKIFSSALNDSILGKAVACLENSGLSMR